jgi:hypothetical protein
VAAAVSSASRDSPDSASISAQSVCRIDAANASKPWVCSAMNAASSTRAPPSARARSSASIKALHKPLSAARSPPFFSCRYCVLTSVWAGVSISVATAD